MLILRRSLVADVGLLALMTGSATAQESALERFDPRGWREHVAGPATEVLVLGSPHLSLQHSPFECPVKGCLLELGLKVTTARAGGFFGLRNTV